MHFYCQTDDDNLSESESSSEEDSSHVIQDTVHSTECETGKKTTATFGYWEKHTKGIGSKLMAKMGYVHGSGLGKEKEGRIDPIEAVIYPPGRSLGNGLITDQIRFV